jgi:adenylate cyclase
LNTSSGDGAVGRIGILAVLAVAAAHLPGILFPDLRGAADARLFDALMQARNGVRAWRPAGSNAVVHIDVNEKTIRTLEGRQPGRREFAVLMGALGSAGAAAQAYDFVFAGPDPENDVKLVDAARGAGNVYAGMVASLPAAAAPAYSFAGQGAAAPAPPWRIVVEGNAPDVLTGQAITASFPALLAASRGAGTLNVQPDRDGVYRRLPLLVKYGDGYYPTLTLAVLAGYLGVAPGTIVFRPGTSLTLPSARIAGGAPRDIVIPVDTAARMALNFFGGWNAEGVRHYGFGDIWLDSFDPTAGGMWRAALAGRLLVIANVSTGRAELGAIPVDPAYPLAGLHTTAMVNILNGTFLRTTPAWVPVVVEIVAIAGLVLAAIRAPRRFWFAGLSVAGLIMLVAAGLFLYSGTIMNVVQPLLTVTILSAAAGTWRYLRESRERELTRRTFESYFPPPVVARLLASRRGVAQSQRKELTILFSDIVGFTARTSVMSPESVQGFLNDYFERMVAIVFRHGGTVDKFIGDGLMVFFNDPDDQPDHAERCVRCALEMLDEIRARDEQGGPPLAIRIGIHTDWVVVGDLGSAQRLSYTAVGAGVNLAQRLESAAPIGGILISRRTAERLPPGMNATAAGEVHVKGFPDPIPVFSIVPAASEVRNEPTAGTAR